MSYRERSREVMATSTSISQIAPAPISTISGSSQNPGPISGDLTQLKKRRPLLSQQSTVQTRRQQAVCVRRAFKQYGRKTNANVVLDGLNMTVPKGCIYGLLGASGCGKTTLLSCIVGRRRLNSGEIWVLGGKPGSRGSGVPGPRIGYMPQEIALYGEFSIRETLLYFGWVCDMTTEEVDSKIDFLIKFLMLPSANRLVKNLSGGQQRRVSFAVALVHDPELLILDEPTVGVDPLLRQNIWDHLVHITMGGNRTVIITTHYIEETRQAHLIGLMRGGYFLAEESPNKLLATYGADSLEDVFLKLSVVQNMGKRRRSSILQEVTDTITVPAGAINEAVSIDEEQGEISGEFGDNISMSGRGVGRRVSLVPDESSSVDPLPPDLPPEDDPHVSTCDRLSCIKSNHMKALLWKNFLWMWRNVPAMVFIVGLPVSQIILFALSIGHDPTGLPIAVKNYELDNIRDGCHYIPGCNNTRMSCRYLQKLEQRSMVLTYHDTEESAKEQVRRGRAWIAMVFRQNYSDAFQNRIDFGRDTDPWDVDSSDIDMYEDKTNQQINVLLFRDLHYALINYIRDYMVSCGISPKVSQIPLRFNDPVYGEKEPNFTDFAAPGIILTIIFFLAVALTSGAMLLERNEGSLERSLVNGITGPELLLAHMITWFIVMAGQTFFSLIVSFTVFGITNNGNYGWVLLLTLMTGCCGMCFGFVVSCVCDTERTATYMAMGSFLPIVMLCGIIWPIEGMHRVLQVISYFLPLTKSTESMRSVMQRGWGMDSEVVYMGFVSTTIWIVVFMTLSVLLLKFKKG